MPQTATDSFEIAARIERLPFSAWHLRVGAIVGTGWFFDGFDALAIAYALPALIPIWHLAPQQIGTLIAMGYVGQLIGSIFFGWLAERWGRVPCAVYTLIIYSVMSLVCAFAWDFQSMMWMRTIQGLGLGGEIPILASYIGEFAKSTHRGRYGLGYQLWFSIGFFVCAATALWIVPSFGWQWLFVIGGAPALLVIPMRAFLPESPRWLATRGRFEDANRILSRIEHTISAGGARPLPPIPGNVALIAKATGHVSDLLRGLYRRRTLAVWAMWFCTYIIVYGLNTWMPSILRTVYHASLSQSIAYGFIGSALGLTFTTTGIFLIDIVGRKPLFTGGLLCSSIPLLILFFNPGFTTIPVMALAMLASSFNSILALGLSTYTAELYPTELRALGTGIGNAWVRFASVVGPYFIGFAIPNFGLGAVFLVFACFALAGGLVALIFAAETKGRVLEDLSPSMRSVPL
ncbi:MAG TPA: MFS transporter [Stellaceae bacterium]|nr:MFS transporter [Stellaceae bacterium]